MLGIRIDGFLGGLFVGCFYWYLYLSNEPPCPVDGVIYEHIGGLPPYTAGRGLDLKRKKDEETGIAKPKASGRRRGG